MPKIETIICMCDDNETARAAAKAVEGTLYGDELIIRSAEGRSWLVHRGDVPASAVGNLVQIIARDFRAEFCRLHNADE